MGVSKSKYSHANGFKTNNNQHVTFDPQQREPVITDSQAALLMRGWHSLKDVISKVGVITFVNLFETHPEVHDAFLPFRSLEMTELKYSTILRSHALRVMGIVDKCISRLNHRDKIREMMTELGIRHKEYALKMDYMDLMGPQFVISIQPHLEAEWTPEHEEAWTNLFLYMCYHMKKGVYSI